MDIKSFQTAYYEYLKKRPFSDPKEYQKVWDTLVAAAKPEHISKGVSKHFDDQIQCSCGWKSPKYWDGMEYAWGDWREHVADQMGLLPKQCACGKKYLPVNNEKACHELRPTRR